MGHGEFFNPFPVLRLSLFGIICPHLLQRTSIRIFRSYYPDFIWHRKNVPLRQTRYEEYSGSPVVTPPVGEGTGVSTNEYDDSRSAKSMRTTRQTSHVHRKVEAEFGYLRFESLAMTPGTIVEIGVCNT